MTGETPEVRSDKKRREEREEEKREEREENHGTSWIIMELRIAN